MIRREWHSQPEIPSLFAQLLQACSDQADALLEEQGFVADPEEVLLRPHFPSIDSSELERLLPNTQLKRGGDGDLHKFVYLERTREQALPLMKCAWNFSKDEPSCRLRVMLFKHLAETKRWVACGFRVESPESPGAEDENLDKKPKSGCTENDGRKRASRHGFWHIQLIREFDKGDSRVEKLIDPNDRVKWLPESDPAFPVAARDPADALLTVLVSLYGPKHVRDLCRGLNWNSQKAVKRLGRLTQP